MPQRREPPGRSRTSGGRGRTPEPAGETDRIEAQSGPSLVTIGGIAVAVIGVLALVLVWHSGTGAVTAPRPAPEPQAEQAPAPAPAHAPAAVKDPPAPAASAHSRAARQFVRGINLGGDGVTIDNQRWLSHAQALGNGLELGQGTAITPPAPLTASGIDFDTKAMLESGCSASGPVRITQRLPNGAYEVTLWVAGAHGLDGRSLVVSLLGAEVPALARPTSAETWARLGPYPVTVGAHRLELALSGQGGAHLAGLAIHAVGTGEANVPPVVGLVRPERDAQLYPGDVPLVADVIPANGRLAKVEFFDGATRLGEVLKPPWQLTWHDPALGTHQLSAMASDTTAVQASSTAIAVTIKKSDGSPEQLLDHAKEELRRLGLEPSVLHQEQDGLHVHLVGAALTSLSCLAGLPIVELDITDTKVSDLAPLAGMPLRRLIMHSVKAISFAPLSGLPLVELRMVKSGISDLTPLARLRLEILQIAGNPLSSLSPIAGMPLRDLDLDGIPAEDFTPLKGLPLEVLILSGTRIRDLAPLAGMPLRRLNLWHCPVTSLSVLHGLPLQELFLEGLTIDFAPIAGLALTDFSCADSNFHDAGLLKGMPLRRLNFWHCPLTSISALTGMPLQYLQLGLTEVEDLSPLSGMAITELNLNNCTKLRSLAPLATMASLQQVSLPGLCPDAEALRKLPGLRIFYAAHDKPMDVATFLAEYQASHPPKP
jgi:hypothetical protein